MEVKREMLHCLQRNEDIYSKHFISMYDPTRLKDTATYGLDFIPNLDGKYPACPQSYWSYTPGCTQLAADTFRIPVAVYPDTDQKLSRRNSGPPLLYLPFEGPIPKAKPLPIVMQYISGCHWSTLQMNRAIKMDWPVIERSIVLACQEMGQTKDLRKIIWRYLSIKKAVCEDNLNASAPIVLD
ncbi:hypothetical protein BJV82DRAFT_368885 [Fennellomyces sp. T-0311]|nr:hypothetical protein BJV82DRAFT_368885 [Fennellomyces sp. T-0311]